MKYLIIVILSFCIIKFSYAQTKEIVILDSIPICVPKESFIDGIISLDSCKINKIVNLDNIYLIYIKEQNSNCIYKIISEDSTEVDKFSISSLYNIEIRSCTYSGNNSFFLAQPQSSYNLLAANGVWVKYEDYPIIRDLYLLIKVRELD